MWHNFVDVCHCSNKIKTEFVGKIGIPDRVLNKADRLTDAEFEIIKSHTIIGSEILQGVSSLSEMYVVAGNHHERYDGKGYPDKKSGEDMHSQNLQMIIDRIFASFFKNSQNTKIKPVYEIK